MIGTPERVLVVGYGPVGARFAENLLPAVRDGRIALTVVGAESSDAYNRVLVAEYAVGAMQRESLTIADRDAVTAAGGRVITGVAVTALDRSARMAALSDGEYIGYDRVVLATGSRANVPTLVGVPRSTGVHRVAGDDEKLPRGVSALRDLDDAERIRGTVANGRRIVVLGAGVLGLEFALAAAHAGASVAVVHHGPHPMPRNLDRGSGAVLRRAVQRTGVSIFAHSRAETVLFRTGDDGQPRFDRLLTADGKEIPGDLLVLSCGVSPRTELAESAGLHASFGVVVDESLRSWSDPSVFAIGDCAHIVDPAAVRHGERLAGAPSGLIGPGWRQADWLAMRFLDELEGGSETSPLPEERDPLVMLKAEHVDVVAAGDVSADPWDDDQDARARRTVGGPGAHPLREDGLGRRHPHRLRLRRHAPDRCRTDAPLRARRRTAGRPIPAAALRRTGLRPVGGGRGSGAARHGVLVQRRDGRAHRRLDRLGQHDGRVHRKRHARGHRMRQLPRSDLGHARAPCRGAGVDLTIRAAAR